jgi:hypothetical protein
MRRAMGKLFGITVGLSLAFCSSASVSGAVKDQSRLPALPGETSKKPEHHPLIPGEILDTRPENGSQPDVGPPVNEEDTIPAMPYEINEIPALEKIRLTEDVAKRALDAFAEIGSKYDDKGLNDYPTLKEFVEKTEAGKQLEAEVKKHGFGDIVEWNTAIMNVSFAFGALLEDQEEDIRAQIASVRGDKSLSEDKKQRIIASLNALIPSKENIEVVRKLQKQTDYMKKLNLLDAFE